MNAGINCQKKRSVSIAQSTEHDRGIPMRMKRFKLRRDELQHEIPPEALVGLVREGEGEPG